MAARPIDETCRPPGDGGSKSEAVPASPTLGDALRRLAGVAPHALALRCDALADVGCRMRELGALDQAESHFAQALQVAGALGVADPAVDLLCELAQTALRRSQRASNAGAPWPAVAARARARERCVEAARLAARSADPQWEIHVLLRIADLLEDCGERAQAIALHCRVLELIVREAAAPR